MIPSLELNWLRKDKDISLPSITIEQCGFSGMYFSPQKDEHLINNTYYPLDKGLIVLNIDDADGGTIAHEWRHHWQFWNGWKYDSIEFDYTREYRKEIIKYFTNSNSEIDAFLFELNKYPNEYILEWYEWLNKDINLYIPPKQTVHPLYTKEEKIIFEPINTDCFNNHFCLPVQLL